MQSVFQAPRLPYPARVVLLTVCTAVWVLLARSYIAHDVYTPGRRLLDTAGPYRAAAGRRYHYPGANLSLPVPPDTSGILTHIPTSFLSDLDPDTLREVTFVTAASETHFNESLDAVGSVQRYFPDRRIMYYDIGLTEDQANKVKSLCRVEYRQFNWTEYPNVVRQLIRTAWKPLVIQEALYDRPAVFWLDSSIRFNSSLPDAVYSRARDSGGLLLFLRCRHSNYNVIHPSMYAYLPTDQVRQRQVVQFGSGAVLLYRTETVFWEVVWWLSLCAGERSCISPTSNRSNWTTSERWTSWGGIHRYDQAGLNLLASNYYSYDPETYSYPSSFFTVERSASGLYPPAVCPGQSEPQDNGPEMERT